MKIINAKNRINNRFDTSRILIIALITSLILITSSCSGKSSWPVFGGSSGKTGSDNSPFTTKTHTGIYGLEMKFIQNQPPSTVYWTGNPVHFPVMLEVRNRGATTIDAGTTGQEGYIYLAGYDKNIIQPSILPPHIDETPLKISDLEAVSNYNPEGGYTVIEFDNVIMRWPMGTDSYEPTFRATACYAYETIATPVLCIDPDPFTTMDEKKICRISNVALAGGQGGPIQVTSIEEEGTEDKLYIKIHLSNAQTSGQVFDYNHVSPLSAEGACPNLQYRFINKVHYTAPVFEGSSTGTGPVLEGCQPDSPLRLVDNNAVIYCQYNIPKSIQTPYQTPLRIKLNYGYMTYEEKRVTIKNVANK